MFFPGDWAGAQVKDNCAFNDRITKSTNAELAYILNCGAPCKVRFNMSTMIELFIVLLMFIKQ